MGSLVKIRVERIPQSRLGQFLFFRDRSGGRRMMFAPRPEKNRHAERDDSAEANPPGKFHYWQPARLLVELSAENAGDVVGKTAQNRDNDEADDHGDNVTAVIAARLGQHARKENSQH